MVLQFSGSKVAHVLGPAPLDETVHHYLGDTDADSARNRPDYGLSYRRIGIVGVRGLRSGGCFPSFSDGFLSQESGNRGKHAGVDVPDDLFG